MTGRIECRYHGARLHRRGDGSAAQADRRAARAQPPRPVEGVLPAHRLVQARRRAQGHDGARTMLAMHGDGLIVLPPPQGKQNRPGPIVFGQDTEPPLFPPPATLDEVRPLEIRTVVGGTRQGRLWNEFVARHHYLGYKTLVGAQMRYAVHDRNGWPLAMLGFSTAAWALAPRDRFIGWTPALRRKNLPMVIDNPRFLILPWIRIPNLGSHILALVRRRCPATGPAATTPHPSSSRPSSKSPASPAASTGPPAGSASEPPRGVGDTTPPGSTASPPRMSGSAPSPSTGSASSTAEQPHPLHDPRNTSHGSTERLPRSRRWTGRSRDCR